jgi:hypothetical protein
MNASTLTYKCISVVGQQGVFKATLGYLFHELTMIHKRYKEGRLGQSNFAQKLKDTSMACPLRSLCTDVY